MKKDNLEYLIHMVSRLNALHRKLDGIMQDEVMQEIDYLVTDPLEELCTEWKVSPEIVKMLGER